MNKKVKCILTFLALSFFLNSCVVLKKDYEAMKSKYQTKVNKLEKENKTLEEMLADKDKTITDLMADTMELRNKIEANKRKYQDLNTQYQDLTKAQEELIKGKSEETQKLLSELHKAQEEMLRREEELQAKEDSLENLKNVLEEQNQRMMKLEEVLNKNQAEVEAIRNKVSEALVMFDKSDLSVYEKNGKVYVSLDEKLLFKTGSTQVDKNGINALKKLAKVLEENPGIDILIEGHTDDVGSADYNWDLSVKRATAIVKILTANSSIDPKRLTAAGRGMYMPVDNTKTDEARRKNRRTEIILTPQLDKLYDIVKQK